MSSPAIVTVPEVGLRLPAMTLKSVVLPAPLGPTSPVIEPSGMVSDSRSTARKPPKAITMSVTVITRAGSSTRGRPGERAPGPPAWVDGNQR